MTIAELIKELMNSAKERAKTPIAGSFVLAFLLYNWRPLFLLMFSDASMEDRIALIDKDYCNTWAIVIPFISAALYVGLVQYIMLVFDYATTYAYNNRKVNKYSRQQHDLRAYRQVLKEQRQNEDIRSGNLAQSQLNDEVERLKGELEVAIKTKQDVVENSDRVISKISDNFERLKSRNEELSKELSDKNIIDIDYVENSKITSVLKKLTRLEKKQFIALIDYYIYGKEGIASISEFSQATYFDLKLIEHIGGAFKITALGKAVYDSIIPTLNY